MKCIKCGVSVKKYNHCDDCYNKSIQSQDYQDIVNKDTPKEIRNRYIIGNIRSNALQCNLCKQIIRSKNIHNYVKCKCGECAIDGGSQYTRLIGEEKNYTTMIEMFDDNLPHNTYK